MQTVPEGSVPQEPVSCVCVGLGCTCTCVLFEGKIFGAFGVKVVTPDNLAVITAILAEPVQGEQQEPLQ